MKTITKSLVAVLTALAALSVIPAEARSGGFSGHGGPAFHGGGYHGGYHGYRGGYWGPGPFWGGLGLGLGIGAIAYYGAYDGYYAYPGYVVSPGYYDDGAIVDPAPAAIVTRPAPQPVPLASRSPDPIFYPKAGQTPAKTETDRQECNRWATTQAGAMNDASIFQRATFACMEGRGYSVR
jgi:hypothetical protein